GKRIFPKQTGAHSVRLMPPSAQADCFRQRALRFIHGRCRTRWTHGVHAIICRSGEMAEWSKAPDSKSGLGQPNGGSNPSLSATTPLSWQENRRDTPGGSDDAQF